MAIEIGPILKVRRERARLTQQELVLHTRMERSSSYISAIENGRTSPTLEELEQLSRYFRTTVIELIQEAQAAEDRRAAWKEADPPADDERFDQAYRDLSEPDRDLTLDFMELLGRRRRGT